MNISERIEEIERTIALHESEILMLRGTLEQLRAEAGKS